MDVNNVVSVNVKAIREQRKLTLDAAAELTGVSRSMLAQIEKGDVNPTISVLWKIANGYKVSFSSLVEKKQASVRILRLKEQTPFTEDNGRFVNHPSFVINEGTLLETYRILIEPEGILSSQPHLNGASEYITLFAGTLEVQVSGERYRLEKGDSISFPANVPHVYRNIGPDAVELSMLIHYKS